MSSGEYFTGYYKIALDANTLTTLDLYIAKYEKKYLVELFGYELYLLFIASLTGTPATPTGRFLTVYNELFYEGSAETDIFYPRDLAYRSINCLSDNNEIETPEPSLSEGISTLLKGFVFWHFVRDLGINVSQTGVVTNKNENSDPALAAVTRDYINERYNESVKSVKVIRNYMKANSTTYPEYGGVNKDYISDFQ